MFLNVVFDAIHRNSEWNKEATGAKLLSLRKLPKFSAHVCIMSLLWKVIVDVRQFSVVTTVL
jgi:hypothetical protein